MFTIIDYHEFYYSEQRRRQSRDGVRYEHTPCAFDVGRGHRNGVEYTLYVYTVYIYIYIYIYISYKRKSCQAYHTAEAQRICAMHFPAYSILHYNVLYCVVLVYSISCCVVLCCVILYHIISCYHIMAPGSSSCRRA